MGFSAAWLAVLCAAVLVSMAPASSEAGPPSDMLRATFGDANTILTDPATEHRPLDRLAAVRALLDTVFDFRDAAERSLGRQWHASSVAEQNDFTRLFTEFMQRGFVYLLALVAKLDTQGPGITVHFLSESVDRETATVETEVVRRGSAPIPLRYDLVDRNQRWVVRDVKIEGVSLVANYRAQFDRVIRASSYPGLVQRLKGRIASELPPLEPAGPGGAEAIRGLPIDAQ
jgi:phospholipid transport system substrate-binding protein